jgi:hypothetical protein
MHLRRDIALQVSNHFSDFSVMLCLDAAAGALELAIPVLHHMKAAQLVGDAQVSQRPDPRWRLVNQT